ncbi:MAG TPA: type B DNA-directed DNA polymerase [Methanoregula sp.]|nr:type B DNA-directed DNA polymerase [Methanoregula sp.]
MWILDSAVRGDGVDLWYRDGTATRVVHHPYDPPFYLHLPDPASCHEMLGSLEERFQASPCTIATIFGGLPGYRVFGDRKIAEAVEQQTGHSARLFNVDVRRDQRFMAERGIVPCSGGDGEGRFSTVFTHDLREMEIRIHGNPSLPAACTGISVTCGDGRPELLGGDGRTLLADLFGLVASYDPDVILMPGADTWMPRLQEQARASGLGMPFSRSGKYRTMDARSYWSYGKMEHRVSALIPDGRILIDTEQSFVYRDGGLSGVFMGARLAGISPNLASRFTPGTLISGYEVYEAVRQGIVVPFRKSDVETARKLSELREADRGGMMFQPAPGAYGNVDEIDFTSLYPTIIVQANLSPETVEHPERRGFLSAALEPLVRLRVRTKRMRKTGPELEGIDSILKWMLVTCFGYTGYKNAKFGRIEVHEEITRRSREILVQTKALAEEMGFTVLHGIVDSLWVQGPAVAALKERVDRRTGIPTEIEHFDWIVFLPQKDRTGAYNRYYGRLDDGGIKVRGIAARRHDTPEFIRVMQREMLTVMSRARTCDGLAQIREEVEGLYLSAVHRLPDADAREMVINRRISRLRYAHRCLEGAAVEAHLRGCAGVAPGMKIGYVVRDARTYAVDTEWEAGKFDVLYYRSLLEKAWEEIRFAFRPVETRTIR